MVYVQLIVLIVCYNFVPNVLLIIVYIIDNVIIHVQYQHIKLLIVMVLIYVYHVVLIVYYVLDSKVVQLVIQVVRYL